MRKKLTVSTMALFWKLTEIGKHLRDCTEEIIVFSKFLASRLDFIKKPDMRPWDFAREWKNAISMFGWHWDASPKTIDPEKTKDRVINITDRKEALDRMMPIFAEDLCGKEFAEVAEMCREDGVGKTELPSYQYHHKENLTVTEEVKNNVNRFQHLLPGNDLSDIEYFPPPPGSEFGINWDPF
ncbi:MAG: hypothetical protein Q8L24_00195 [bacterium]|nr:hypothetical protein [bacterium]